MNFDRNDFAVRMDFIRLFVPPNTPSPYDCSPSWTSTYLRCNVMRVMRNIYCTYIWYQGELLRRVRRGSTIRWLQDEWLRTRTGWVLTRPLHTSEDGHHTSAAEELLSVVVLWTVIIWTVMPWTVMLWTVMLWRVMLGWLALSCRR